MEWMENPAKDSTKQLSLKSDVVSILSISFAKSTFVIDDFLPVASKLIKGVDVDWFKVSFRSK